LTKPRRQKMNSLVDLMNKRIGEIVKAKATKNSKGQDNVIFVNYDEYYGDVKGRFCTKGVSKPEQERKYDLTFYPLDFADPLGQKNFKRDEAVDVFNGTFEGDIDFLSVLADVSGAKYRSNVPKVKAKAKTQMLGASAAKASEGEAVKSAAVANPRIQKRSYLPDGFGRTFHPTIAGHSVIAKLVLWKLSERNAKQLGVGYAPETATLDDKGSCPLNNGPKLQAKCTGSDKSPSGLPAQVFHSINDNKGIFDEFCKQMDGNKLDDRVSQKWTVNAKGEHQKGSSKSKRAPPPNPNSYKQKINFSWTPNKMNHNCKASCHDAYKGMAESECGRVGGDQKTMAVKAQYNIDCGTFSYEITGEGVPQPEPARCLIWKGAVSAPKGDRERDAGKGTSVEAAYKKFCEANDGKELEGKAPNDGVSQRFAATNWGVENRSSIWVRATFIEGCQGKVKIDKKTCMKKLGDGLGHCDKNSGFTHGYTTSSECIEYTVQPSFATRDDWPPWNPGAVKASFPPTEDVDAKTPQ